MTPGATAAVWISLRRAARLSPGSTASGGGSRNRRHQHHPGSSPRRPNTATTSGQRSAVATSSWMLTTGQPDRSLANSRSASHRPVPHQYLRALSAWPDREPILPRQPTSRGGRCASAIATRRCSVETRLRAHRTTSHGASRPVPIGSSAWLGVLAERAVGQGDDPSGS